MKVFIVKNKGAGDKKAFEIIKSQIIKKPDSLFGLAVGKTTDGLYKLISKDAVKNPNLWEKVKLFQIDEYFGIGPDSTLSFNKEIKRELSSLLKTLKKKNIFLIDGRKNPSQTIKEAYDFIKRNNGFDLIILGIGPKYDPHIAYNTTGKSALNSRMRVIDLHPRVASVIARHGKLTMTYKGITIGIQDILKSKKVLLIAYGKEKTKSIKLAFKGKVDTKRASASALQLHKDLNIVIDKAAGRFL